MKSTLLFLMLLLSGMAGAQIVNIPDAAFKAELLSATASNGIAKNSSGNAIAIDANNDNEIQVSEALAVWELTGLDDGDKTNMQGIEAFANLRKLDCSESNDLTALDCTSLINLKILDCSESMHITELNVHGLENLEELYASNCLFNSLDLTGVTNLKKLDVYSAPSLSNIISLSSCVNIEQLLLEVDNIQYLDLTQMENLQTLYLPIVGEGNLKHLMLGNKPYMTYADIEAGNMTELDMSGCTALNYLLLYVHHQSGVPDLFINLKNGTSLGENSRFIFESDDNDEYVYICLDEGEEEVFPNIIEGNFLHMLSTYCSFTPGGDYNTIAGSLTFDADNNGCGGSDSFNGFLKVNITDGTEEGTLFTIGSGQYDLYTQSGTFTITPEFENDWFTATPPFADITFTEVNNSITTQNFCIAANGVHPDVEAVMTGGLAQPGFDAGYRIIYKNKGNQQLSGTVTLNYNGSVLAYIQAYPAESTAVAGTLTWDYTGLMPFESRYIDVSFNLNGPMDNPAVIIGDILPFSITATPLTGDETPDDNTFDFNQTVVGSYDPNDIACLEGESVSPDKIGGYLHYTINFENTGTAPASFIVVKDIINEGKFDISSLQVLGTSHNVETRINGNKVEFIFDNINLGPQEKGNVTFKIKTLNSLQVNDNVTQQADIFFDYNWPVQTNEAVTIFEVLGLGEFDMDSSVKVYPNPAKNIVTISADSTVRSVELYDVQGRMLQSGSVNGQEVSLDISARSNGIYFIKTQTEKGVAMEKLVKD